MLDGDDSFYTNRSLQIIAATYSRYDCWMTYGSWISHIAYTPEKFPAYEEGTTDFRGGPWLATAVRTWKKWLWDLVDDRDFRDENGHYFCIAEDLAVMFPMLEMSGTARARRIPDILMLYNRQDPSLTSETRRVELARVESFIRARPPYSRLKDKPIIDKPTAASGSDQSAPLTKRAANNRNVLAGSGFQNDLNEIFPHKVCINLDRRPERWKQMQAKFARHGIRDVKRFSAVDGQSVKIPRNWPAPAGAYGCLLSHLEVVREARRIGAPSVLIFEDDVAFDDRFQEKFGTYIDQLPPDWEMLHFGALHLDDPLEVSRNIQRIRSAYSTYAYALKSTIFDSFIESNSEERRAVDANNLLLQAAHPCYCFAPHLAWVESGHSDAQGRQNNYWYLEQSLVIKGRAMDDLLNKTALVIACTNPTRSDSIIQNLLFLTRFYTERLRGVRIVIVEQGPSTTVDQSMLPAGCQYVFQQKGGAFNRAVCFAAGVRRLEQNQELVIFSDCDIFLEEWDICGNLRMCERFDAATGFRSIIELTSSDTSMLHRDTAVLLRWFEANKYAAVEKRGWSDRFAIFNRRSIEAAGGWEERLQLDARNATAGNGGEKSLSSILPAGLRVFESPNSALRMYCD
jgi:GR25 family glycosyltransferase involved in LPS biosynthesis